MHIEFLIDYGELKEAVRRRLIGTGNGDMTANSGNSFIPRTTTVVVKIRTANVDFFYPSKLDKSACVQTIATMTDTRKWNYSCFGTNLAISGCDQLLLTLLSKSTWSKISNLSWHYLSYFPYKYFRFCGHIAISGCRTSSKSLALYSPWSIL